MPVTIVKYSLKPSASLKEHLSSIRWVQQIVPIGTKVLYLTVDHVRCANLARTLYRLKQQGDLGFMLGIPSNEHETASRLFRQIEQINIGEDRATYTKTYCYIFDSVQSLETLPPLPGMWHVHITIKQDGTISLKDVNTVFSNLVHNRIAVSAIQTSVSTGFTSTQYIIVLTPIGDQP